MKKKTFITLVILLILLMITLYLVYIFRNNLSSEEKKITSEYEAYYNQEKTGTELVSIINRTVDINNKNNVQKNEENLYIENDTNSIKIYIGFLYKDETRILEMERIVDNGIDNFIKAYSTANFKCTEVTYHDKSKNIKSLTFIQTED